MKPTVILGESFYCTYVRLYVPVFPEKFRVLRVLFHHLLSDLQVLDHNNSSKQYDAVRRAGIGAGIKVLDCLKRLGRGASLRELEDGSQMGKGTTNAYMRRIPSDVKLAYGETKMNGRPPKQRLVP